MASEKIRSILNYAHPIVGYRTLNVSFGKRYLVRVEFENTASSSNELSDDTWRLSLLHCAWRVQDDKQVYVASGDAREKMMIELERLRDRVVVDIDIAEPAFDTTIKYDNGLTIRLFPRYSDNQRIHWMLFMPDGLYIQIGPGNNWSVLTDEDEK